MHSLKQDDVNLAMEIEPSWCKAQSREISQPSWGPLLRKFRPKLHYRKGQACRLRCSLAQKRSLQICQQALRGLRRWEDAGHLYSG